MTTIRPDTRIGDLLKAHPDLLEVLTRYHPTFSKLRNPLLRRTIGHMATLAQAAGIAGADLFDLLRTLREAIGETEPEPEASTEPPMRLPLSAAAPEPPAWFDEDRIAAHLDARSLHAQGQNPLGPILKAAKKVSEGEILALRNTFEPLPLYDLLGKQGFIPWSRQRAPDDWEISFYRAEPGESVAHPAPEAPETGASPVASVTINVTELTPPEPMMRVLEALAQLAPGETLLVRHVQRPMYLYRKLDEMGHAHQTWEMGPDRIEILIRAGKERKIE